MKKTKSDSILSVDNRKTSQGYVDLKKKSKEELEELIERQNKLLLNRSFIQKLPDKGEKIILFKTQLENELEKRQQAYETTCHLLDKLTLNESEHIEWNKGKLVNNGKSLDSDDDDDYDDGDNKTGEVNPLKLIANHSGTASGKTIIKKSSTNLSNAHKIFYVDKFCEKYGNNIKTKERFKPNQLKNNDKDRFVTSAEKVKQKLGEKWEVTQATPPVPVYKDTVMISLTESLKLQKQQDEKLKEIEKKYAAERLLRNIGVKMGDKLPVTNVKEYRTQLDDVEDDEEESCNDSEDEEKNFEFPVENKEIEAVGVTLIDLPKNSNPKEMESKGSTSNRGTTKSMLPLNRKPRSTSSHQDRTSKVPQSASEEKDGELMGKVEEKKKGEIITRKRPSTAYGNFKRKTQPEGSENSKGKTNKIGDRGPVGSSSIPTKNNKQVKPRSTSLSKTPNKQDKIEIPETPGSSSLLSLAIEAQKQTTTTMRLLRDALRTKAEEIQEKIKADAKLRKDVEPNDTNKPILYAGPSACFFENSYASCLDEVFQAWINLLYLIMNLKVTLNRVLNASKTDTITPNLESEKELITQATECLKFFSQLKMKSLMEGFEEINDVEDTKMKNFQILDFEERISSSFFSEMETLSKKALEVMSSFKKEPPPIEIN